MKSDMNQKKNLEELKSAFQTPLAKKLIEMNARQMRADAARRERLAQQNSQQQSEE